MSKMLNSAEITHCDHGKFLESDCDDCEKAFSQFKKTCIGVCKVCSKPDCLGPGQIGSRAGKRCIGTIEKEAHPHPLDEDQLQEIAEYQLECFSQSKAGLTFNGRFLLSMIIELRELRQMKADLEKLWKTKSHLTPG